MLNISPENMREEIESAIKLREKITDLSEERIRGEHGSDYMDGIEPEVEPHENHSHDYRSVILPKIAYYNPDVTFKSRRPVVQRLLVEAMQLGTSRWIHDVNLIETLRLIGLDMLFDFGVALVSLEPSPGYENNPTPPMRPSVVRISPRRYFCDPQASGYHARRYEGHIWVRDMDDLMRARDKRTGKALYDKEVLKKLRNDGRDKLVETMNLQKLGIQAADRNQVVGFEVYVPEHKQVLTLAFGDESAGFLRPPRKAFCPPWGPYTLFGVFAVADQVYPLAPLAIPQALVDELNAQIDQNARLADEAGTFHVVNSPNQKLQNVMRKAPPGSILYLPGFDQSQIAEVTRPGPSRESLDYVDRLRERLDRKSGLTDVQRGEITGKATAFEVNKAATSGDIRTRFIQSQFGECARRVVETAAWYLAYSYSVMFTLPVTKQPVAATQGAGSMGGALWAGREEMEDGEFLGGVQEGQEDFDWYDLEMSIDPKSMEMEDDALQTAQWMNFAQWLAQTAAVMPQTPWVNWPKLVEMTGDHFNVPDASNLIDFQMVAGMIGTPGFQGSPPAEDPREILARNAPPKAGAGKMKLAGAA